MIDYKMLYDKSYKLKKRFIEIFSEIGYGHLTTAYSEAEILILLMEVIMNYKPGDEDSDRLVISKGHGAGFLYPIWEDMGLLTKEDLQKLVSLGGDYSEVQRWFYPGFEFYGGSLGIGFGMASGMALADKLNRKSNITFCLVGDAECYEGSMWEAMLFAAHNHLNNLVVIVDRNYLGVSDFTENMCELEPFEDKWKACNWDTVCLDGHSYEQLFDALKFIHTRRSCKPLCIIAETIKGNGANHTYNIPMMHGYFPKNDDVKLTLDELEKNRK